MTCKWSISWIVSLLACLCLTGLVHCHREEECVEVGFARSSYLTVDQGFQAAKEQLLSTWEKEEETGHPSYSFVSPQVKNITRTAQLLELTSKNILALIRKTRVGKRCPEEWLIKGLEKHVTPLIQLDKELAESLGLVMSFRCLVGSPYPNVDGTCINEEGPDIGSIGAKFLRLLPPISGKGGFDLRSSSNREKSLPSARKVAQLIRRHMNKSPVTALFTEFSHFVAQDSISIPESPSAEGINCCDNPDHVDCSPILLDEDDPMYSTIKCLNFKRSIPAQAILGHRESLSMISTYLDATPIYGATNEAAFKLKEGYFGYLRYPPSVDNDEDGNKIKNLNCQFPKSFKGCFNLDPEDDHFIENLRLLLILEHNLIADALSEINPHFDDSLLYNEARRIVIAEYDAIVYGEFLPLLVGKELVEKHSLLPGSEGPGARFISEVNPGILTCHALASYRNPSMIDEWRAEWGKTDILSPLHYHSIKDDPYQDLLAMDVQRGRDHGLPHYSAWRSFCDPGKHLESWEDLERVFAKEVVEDLRQLYQDEPKDLDLLVALLETPEEGTLVGKTFACILVDQFARLKTGNRLYWEHETSMLTKEQRDSIRTRSSSAGLLCRHFPLKKIPQNPFLPLSESNPEVDCDTVVKMDLVAWHDTSLIEVMEQRKQEQEKQEQEKQDQEKQDQETRESKQKEEEEQAKINEQEQIKKAEEEQREKEKRLKEEQKKEEERIKEHKIAEEKIKQELREKQEKKKKDEETQPEKVERKDQKDKVEL